MFISDRMSPDVVTVGEQDSVQQAVDRMAERRIHRLPVVRGGDRLVGIVTDRDVRSVHSEAARSRPVSEVMTTHVMTVSPDEPLEDALLLLHRYRFGSLPVVTSAPGLTPGYSLLTKPRGRV